MLRRLSLLLSLVMLLSLFPTTPGSSLTAVSAKSSGPYAAEPSMGLSLNLLPQAEELAVGETAAATLVLHPAVDIREFAVTVTAEGAAVLKSDRSFTLPAAGAGTDVQVPIQYVPHKNGDATIRVTVSAIRTDGRPLPTISGEVDLFAADDVAYQGTDGKQALKLKHVEKRKAKGAISAEEYRQERKLILGGGARSAITLQDEPITIAAAGYITIKGTVRYTDSTGATHPVRSAVVEILDEDTLFDDVVATVTTSDAGEYTATVPNDTGLLEKGLDLFIRVWAKSDGFYIESGGLFGDQHRIDSAVNQNTQSGKVLTIDLTANNTDDNNTAFAVHDALVTAVRYVKRVNGARFRELEVNFPKSSLLCSGAGGSCYTGALNIAKLDRFDWDVVLHEFGHFVADELDADDSPGGSHSFGQNLSTTYGKSKGIRLSWSEGWATYFALIAQQVEGAAALGLPNVGDTSYSETEESTWSQNIENGGGAGEDDELSVVGAMWDLTDSVDDGEDKGIHFADTLIWNTVKTARPTIVSDFYKAINNGKPIKEESAVGCVFGENHIAASGQTPANGYLVKPTPIPTFSWAGHMNDRFVVEFYDSTFTNLLFATPEQAATDFTPTQEQWDTIRKGTDQTINWVVKATWSAAPLTGPYTSCKREMKKPNQLDLVFLIDTTGSMWDDIANVKSSAASIVDAIAAGGRDYRVAVADYKDHPVYPYGEKSDYPYRAVLGFTKDKAAFTGAINSLGASGGWDWEESVFSGLMGAISANGLGAWRTDAQKIIILMGDAPPHDPEPITGYTHAQVVDAAKKAGVDTQQGTFAALSVIAADAGDGSGARIFSIVVGGNTSTYQAFARLSADTDGQVFTAATASDVSKAILDAVGAIDDDPTNRPPDVTGATPSVDRLWSVNHKLVEVQILNVVDPDGDKVTITITGIRQNEPVNDKGSGNTDPDGEGVGTSSAWVRAERSGPDSSRVYEIFFRAEDGKGGASEGSVLVSVPHDQRPNSALPTDGIRYDSTRR